MTASEYEGLVSTLAADLTATSAHAERAELHHGVMNRIAGGSGYSHQIDVSVTIAGRLLMFECKCWKKAIDPEAVLAFVARLIDIRAAHEDREVTGRLATTVGVSPGAAKIATYFGIGIDIVKSTSDYAVRVWEHVGAGKTESAVASDSYEAVVQPKRGLP